jgi:hypothetical protein
MHRHNLKLLTHNAAEALSNKSQLVVDELARRADEQSQYCIVQYIPA